MTGERQFSGRRISVFFIILQDYTFILLLYFQLHIIWDILGRKLDRVQASSRHWPHIHQLYI